MSSWGGTRASSRRRFGDSRGARRPRAPRLRIGGRRIRSTCRKCRSRPTPSSPTWEKVCAKLGRCQTAVSEGIRDAKVREIGPKPCGGRARSTPMAPWSFRVRVHSATGSPTSSRRGSRRKAASPERARRHVRLYPSMLVVCLSGRYGRSAGSGCYAAKLRRGATPRPR